MWLDNSCFCVNLHHIGHLSCSVQPTLDRILGLSSHSKSSGHVLLHDTYHKFPRSRANKPQSSHLISTLYLNLSTNMAAIKSSCTIRVVIAAFLIVWAYWSIVTVSFEKYMRLLDYKLIVHLIQQLSVAENLRRLFLRMAGSKCSLWQFASPQEW